MALIGLHVTQYMYVLFDKVHFYIKKSLFTLARCYVLPPKHLVKVQRAMSIYRNSFTEKAHHGII
jgi:hypothetical protein